MQTATKEYLNALAWQQRAEKAEADQAATGPAGAWISVGEALPPPQPRPGHYSARVLVLWTNGHQEITRYYAGAPGWWEGRRQLSGIFRHGSTPEVTHWQPLPAAP